MKRKIEEKIKAIKLREKGYSLNEIIRILGVAKSSASGWVRNVDLNNKARERLLTRIKKGQLIGAEKKRERTRLKTEAHFKEAIGGLKEIKIDRFSARLFCSLLYWCEGGKNTLTGVRFTNSDPTLIKTFLNVFRSGFDVHESKLRVGIHLHQYHNWRQQRKFWSKIASIPENKFIKPYLKQNTGKRIKNNYPGCATIYYHHNDTVRNLLETARAFFSVTGA